MTDVDVPAPRWRTATLWPLPPEHAALKFLDERWTQAEVDQHLGKVMEMLRQKERQARATAAAAKAAGNLVKCQKFQAVARAYDLACREIEVICVPF